jgi:hypothetical protein
MAFLVSGLDPAGLADAGMSSVSPVSDFFL